MRSENWTNRSVKLFAGKKDPIEAITRRAREVVLAARDEGWSGPPFDPFALSDFLKLMPTTNADQINADLLAFIMQRKEAAA
jgi:hypothetical protein